MLCATETLGETTTSGVSSVSGEGGEGGEGVEDDEVDFGYWEKAELPAQEQSPADPHTDSLLHSEPGSKGTALPASLPRDMDLSLL